jgi:hypothetical protein
VDKELGGPSWAVVPTGDKAAGTDVLRRMAERAGATISEAEGSQLAAELLAVPGQRPQRQQPAAGGVH